MRLQFLDLLRVFACMSVLIGHKLYGQYSSALNDPKVHVSVKLILEAFNPFIQYGGCGLVVFFLISGYIITKVLQKEGAPEFMIRRIFRIYPIYWVAILINMVIDKLVLGIALPSFEESLERLSLLGDFFNTPYSLGGVEWSLRLEMCFYIVMTFLRVFGVINRAKILFVIYLLWIASLPFLPPFPVHTAWANGYVLAYSTFLIIGSVIYIIEEYKSVVVFGVSIIIYSLGIYFHLISTINPITSHSHFALVGFLFFVISWRYLRHMHINRFISSFASLTYSIYLFHFWIWDYLYFLFVRVNIPKACVYVIIFIVLCCICYFMNKCIEMPAINLGSRVVRRYFYRRDFQNNNASA